jgi:outer membrane protein
MRRSSRRARWLSAVALLALAQAAQGRTLDRRGAVKAAMAETPQVAAARAAEAAMAAQKRQADAARWPVFTLDVGIGPSMIATLVPGTAAQSKEQAYHDFHWSDFSALFIGNVGLVQPLYTFGKIANRQEAAVHGLRARAAQTRMQRADVGVEVARIYEGFLYARDLYRFFDEMDHWLARTLEGTQQKLAQHVQGVSDRDVLRLQAARGLAALGLHEAQAGQDEARAGLAAYLGLPRDEVLTFAEDELVPVGRVPPDVKTLVRLAADHRPELVALREGSRALEALARAEAASFKPTIFLLGLVSAAYTPGRDWIESRFIYDPLNHFVPGALLGLHWDFQGGMARARADEQRAQAEVLARTGDWADAGIPAQVRKAYDEVVRCDKDLASGGEAVHKAKQWMVEASADYNVGLLDIKELADAVNSYVTLRVAVLKARYDRNVAMAELSRATGTLDSDSDLFYLAPGGDGTANP